MKRLTILFAALSFILPFLLYALTACRTVTWYDSGALITDAFTLSIPHPPGHPLYPILGKWFTWLPIGSVAFRINLMSGFFAGLSCFFLYRLVWIVSGVETMTRDFSRLLVAWISLSASLFFAVSPALWNTAIVAETYSLHTCFMLGLALLAAKMTSTKRPERYLPLFGFCAGVSLTNHVAGVFMMVPFVLLLFGILGRRMLMERNVLSFLGWGVFGLTLYAYLPLRSMGNPVIDWGDPQNLQNFLDVVTARQFMRGISTAGYFSAVGMDEISNYIWNAFHIGWFMVLSGFAFRGRRCFVWVCFTLLVIMILYTVCTNAAFVKEYFLPALALSSLWIGIGSLSIMEWLLNVRAYPARKSLSIIFLSTLMAVPLGRGMLNYPEMDLSENRNAYHYADLMLKDVPPDSLILISDNHAMFLLWYRIYCEPGYQKANPDRTMNQPM